MTRKLTMTRRRTESSFSGSSWTIEVDGVAYQCSLSRGKYVRIPYQPRGHNIGYHWHGAVYGPKGRVWSDRVTKSTGPYWMLFAADLIDPVDYPRLGQKPGEGPRDFCKDHGWYSRAGSCWGCAHSPHPKEGTP
jgi:hypothetical protein